MALLNDKIVDASRRDQNMRSLLGTSEHQMASLVTPAQLEEKSAVPIDVYYISYMIYYISYMILYIYKYHNIYYILYKKKNI